MSGPCSISRCPTTTFGRSSPPTLLIYGAESVYFEAPIAARLRELRPDLPQLHVEGAGHNVHADRDDVVGPAVAEFLRSTGP